MWTRCYPCWDDVDDVHSVVVADVSLESHVEDIVVESIVCRVSFMWKNRDLRRMAGSLREQRGERSIQIVRIGSRVGRPNSGCVAARLKGQVSVQGPGAQNRDYGHEGGGYGTTVSRDLRLGIGTLPLRWRLFKKRCP